MHHITIDVAPISSSLPHRDHLHYPPPPPLRALIFPPDFCALRFQQRLISSVENFYLFYSKFFIFHQLNDSNCLNESSIVKSAFLKENGSPRLPTRFLRIASGNERNIRVPKSARLIITTLEILSLNERRPSHFTRRQRSRGESVEGGPVTEVECLHSSRAPSPQGWDILPTGL